MARRPPFDFIYQVSIMLYALGKKSGVYPFNSRLVDEGDQVPEDISFLCL